VAQQAEHLAKLDGDALVLDGERLPFEWADQGYSEPGPPVGLVLEPSIPLSSVLKAASTLRRQRHTLVLLPPTAR
jgi:hypothetical protein